MTTWRTKWASPQSPSATPSELWSLEELTAREAEAGIRPDSPFLVDPTGATDAYMTAYLNSMRFRKLAPNTQISYVTDYRLFFDFLWRRKESRWLDATEFDIEDFEDWRRRAKDNPRPVGGSKWMRELAALKKLYDWAVRKRLIEASPLATVFVRGRDGERIEVLEAAASDVQRTNVKWLTPRMARVWRDVGLRGFSAAGLADDSFRGRTGDRNAAFFDLLWDSGLRRAEGGSLLVSELPRIDGPKDHVWGRVARAVAKNRSGREFAVTKTTLSRIRAYSETSRAAAVRSAQQNGRYERVRNKRIVVQTGESARGATVQSVDEETGEVRASLVDNLSVAERAKLFVRSEHGLEPMWLWLSESGLPFKPHSWEEVFAAGSRRCLAVLGSEAPRCTPHMARHSFALIMLVALTYAFDERYGLTPEQRRDFALIYKHPYRMVKDLLGHRSEKTTRDVYLVPVQGVEIRSLLGGDSEYGNAFLQALAAASPTMKDWPDEQ